MTAKEFFKNHPEATGGWKVGDDWFLPQYSGSANDFAQRTGQKAVWVSAKADEAAASTKGEATTEPNGDATTELNGEATTEPNGEATTELNGEATTEPNGDATTTKPNGKAKDKK